ncbi:sodium- and chloride-dependent glycine transporter 1-like isoform X1 [Cherax quadricarinatus]|uniref:sodium- and chloride-dependent glycine transporter 1-like isoform X1 n=1 Tax=Cherax quadricarinatus TaxID=27406 RepID=UPI00387EA275
MTGDAPVIATTTTTTVAETAGKAIATSFTTDITSTVTTTTTTTDSTTTVTTTTDNTPTVDATINSTFTVATAPANLSTAITITNEKMSMEEGHGGDDRVKWGSKLQFFCYCLSYAVGFGNVWRFPYLCYKNGGAAFLIPYTTMLLCVGLPIFFMELALGQYVSLGPGRLFPKMAPIFSGLGWGMVMLSLLTAIYFNVIIAWTFFYTVASFSSQLPWARCDNYFNSPECFTEEDASVCKNNSLYYYNRTCLDTHEYCSLASLSDYNDTHCYSPENHDVIREADGAVYRMSASEDFFRNRMLAVGGRHWEDMGGMRWELFGYLALSWVIVAACLAKGVKTTGKITYFTAFFPYVVLFILFIRAITLDGAYQGIQFYLLEPNISQLMEMEVWSDAAIQICFSLGICFGCLSTLASYNKFNNNCMRDAIVISFSNCLTSIFVGFVTFSVLGFLAKQLGVEVKDVATSGSGLAFVVYPAALSLMPLPQLWSVLFFLMLMSLGFGSQFTMVETVTTALADQFEWMRQRKTLVVVTTCVIIFLMGLTMCLEGGIFMFELFFFYSAGVSVIMLGILQLLGVQYVYGFSKLMRNLREMGMRLTCPVYWYWCSMWLVVTPGALLMIIFFSVYFYVPAFWGDYVFPHNVQVLGWLLCAFSVACFPIGAVYAICTHKKDFKNLFHTSPEFCPASARQLLKIGEEPASTFRHTRDNEAFAPDDEL